MYKQLISDAIVYIKEHGDDADWADYLLEASGKFSADDEDKPSLQNWAVIWKTARYACENFLQDDKEYEAWLAKERQDISL